MKTINVSYNPVLKLIIILVWHQKLMEILENYHHKLSSHLEKLAYNKITGFFEIINFFYD